MSLWQYNCSGSCEAMAPPKVDFSVMNFGTMTVGAADKGTRRGARRGAARARGCCLQRDAVALPPVPLSTGRPLAAAGWAG